MKCVILAGGLGTRLSEETDRIPKPMVQIGGYPILWHIIKLYSHWGVNDFIICLGYRGYVIKEYFANYFLHMSDVTFDFRNGGQMQVIQNQVEPWRVTLVDTGLNTMTGGRLKRVMPLLGDDDAFCMTYGDGLSDVNIASVIAAHRASGKLATVTAVPPQQRFGLLMLEGDQVSAFAEKPETDETWINGGFFVLSPKVGDYLGDDQTIWERAPLERLTAEGQLNAYRHAGFWQPMDTLREKTMLEDLWAKGAPWKVWP
ncbi:MAG: glucose-1-phosphate cytidylyltransferase [Alphaproteobacteria bacterium]|nr:glucose-1-phosphate cytidylyltransferase [Alphaproteobacteria bacterium]